MTQADEMDYSTNKKEKNMGNRRSTKQLKDILERWSAQNQLRVKESTYNRYQYLIHSNILPYLGEYRVSEITTELMQNYIHFLLTDNNLRTPLSPKTVRDTVAVVKQALRFARTLGIESPCDAAALTIRMEKTELRVLTQEEYRRLVNRLLGSESLVDAGILLALFTGLRIGELCALRWDNINLDEKYIAIKYTMQRVQNRSDGTSTKTKVILTSPKSFSSVREIPLPDFLISYLRAFERTDTSFFLTGCPAKYIEPRNLEYQFKRILTELDIEMTHFHTLRHTFATRCIESQFDVKTLSEILGHSSVNMTLNRYVHPSLENKRKQMDKLGGMFCAM